MNTYKIQVIGAMSKTWFDLDDDKYQNLDAKQAEFIIKQLKKQHGDFFRIV